MKRRQFLKLMFAGASAPAVVRLSWAQSYPVRPVRIVVGFGPGGVTDITARIIAQWLSKRLGQPFVVENRPGAGSNIGTEAVIRSSADGYTLLLATTANAVNATIYNKLNFDFIRDVAPVASLNSTPCVMAVNPNVPATTVPEFIAYAKANPGKINMAAIGIGSASHISGELFKIMTGLDLITVQYRDPGPAHTDLITGQVDVIFDPVVSSIEQIKAGQLRALAVTTRARAEALPDVPTVGDFVPGYPQSDVWTGVVAPRGTPIEIINRLGNEINVALADPKIKSRMAELGAVVLASSPAQFQKFIIEEIEKWGKVVRAANIRME
jgi:tripartite-type tricarboxylate transporter receptor subunit TctC